MIRPAQSTRHHGPVVAPVQPAMAQLKRSIRRGLLGAGALTLGVGLSACTTVYHPPLQEASYVTPRQPSSAAWTMALGPAGNPGIESRRDNALGVRTSEDVLTRGQWSDRGPDATYWRTIRLPTRAEDVIIFERGRERRSHSHWNWGY